MNIMNIINMDGDRFGDVFNDDDDNLRAELEHAENLTALTEELDNANIDDLNIPVVPAHNHSFSTMTVIVLVAFLFAVIVIGINTNLFCRHTGVYPSLSFSTGLESLEGTVSLTSYPHFLVSVDWGDGTPAGTSLTHTYVGDGFYTVTVRIVDDNGLEGSEDVLIAIEHVDPILMRVSKVPTRLLDFESAVASFSISCGECGSFGFFDIEVHWGDGIKPTLVSGQSIMASSEVNRRSMKNLHRTSTPASLPLGLCKGRGPGDFVLVHVSKVPSYHQNPSIYCVYQSLFSFLGYISIIMSDVNGWKDSDRLTQYVKEMEARMNVCQKEISDFCDVAGTPFYQLVDGVSNQVALWHAMVSATFFYTVSTIHDAIAHNSNVLAYAVLFLFGLCLSIGIYKYTSKFW
jgi:hypothetical protein